MDKELLFSRIDVPKSRVIVKSLWGEAGRRGVMKGDVVTHLNGEEFHGNAQDLVKVIRELVLANEKNGDRKYLTLVLNAEAPIAEALKRRANVSLR
eukprot:CAMPEP_0172491514 /NCGR_PEP_ID=MMETSP1066-20121228/22368_1 /TAXON_ID=671091 /ORGANISM="Coscinodiscus wailesii, Strain CCMP2513" /LENGTH=95 /DNA_ID=CAMNT_0013260609 /DNA_START=164 /DNA_END=451 /DNA_ORIENTATION=-